MRLRDAVFLILGLVLGVFAARACSPAARTTEPALSASSSAPHPREALERGAFAGPSERGSQRAFVGGASGDRRGSKPSPSRAGSGHAEALETVRELERELQAARHELERLTGTAHQPPSDLAERFFSAEIAESLAMAVDAFDGTLSAVDCSEYPCFAYGEMPHPGGEAGWALRALLEEPALDGYARDGRAAYAWDSEDPVTGTMRTHFGVAFYPQAGGSGAERLQRRLGIRWNEWLSTVLTPDPPE